MKIAFLTLNFLKGHNYAINYYLAILLERIHKEFNLEKITILSHVESGRADRSYSEIMENFRIPDYCTDVDFANVNGEEQVEDVCEMLADYDLVVPVSYFWGHLIKKLKNKSPNVQVVYWISSIIYHEYIVDPSRKKADFYDIVSAQKKIVEYADHLIFNSGYDKELALRYFNVDESQTSVIYPVSRFDNKNTNSQKSFSSTEEDFVIGYAGRWDYRKGLHLLLDTFNKYQEEHGGKLKAVTNFNECRFSTLNEHLPENSEILYHRLFYGGRFEMLPWLSDRRQYLQFIKDCDVLVIPSLYDPFNMIAFDAIKMHTPLVLSRFCGISEMIEDQPMVRLVNPIDREEMLEAIVSLKEMIVQKRHLDCPVKPLKFDSNKMIDQTFDLYKSLTNQR